MTSTFRNLLSTTSPDGERSSPSRSDDRSQSLTDDAAKTPAKRNQVSVACQTCRKHKAKCDGQQPCQRCRTRRFSCEYEIRPDETRGGALRKRIESLQSAQTDIQELFTFIRTRSEAEAREIFRRIRDNEDPFEVLRIVRQGDLLQQQIGGEPDPQDSPRLVRLDAEALQASAFKLRARPWTVVAGDGLVSELISSFFLWDQPFYFSFIDRELFLADMELSDPARARFCSPMLLNAICALRSDKDLCKDFLDEAKRFFDEELGRPSLPTIQALLVMYVCFVGVGKDRAGKIYRQAAYEMTKHLSLERRFFSLMKEESYDSRAPERRAISRALWGIYCFESISAFAFLQPSLVKSPTIPRLFDEPDPSSVAFTDVHGHEFSTTSSTQPRLTKGVLNAMCDLSELLYSLMSFMVESTANLGSEEDIEKRVAFFNAVLEWRLRLPNALKSEHMFLPQTFYLSAYEDMIIIAIFRPLAPETRLPYGLGCAGDQCIARCDRSLNGLEHYMAVWPLKDYSILALHPLYNCSMTLVTLLDYPRTHDLFAKACHYLLQRAHDFPFAMYVLEGLKILASQCNREIPTAAHQYFTSVRIRKDGLRDVPISFVLPKHLEAVALLLSDDADGGPQNELGSLISRYNSITLDGI